MEVSVTVSVVIGLEILQHIEKLSNWRANQKLFAVTDTATLASTNPHPNKFLLQEIFAITNSDLHQHIADRRKV
jgi:hypothetical protein